MVRTAMAAVASILMAGCACCGSGAGGQGKVEHMVLLRFKDGTTPQERDQVMAAFRKLPSSIPGIVRFEDGPNISNEKLDKGYTQGVIVTFRDKASRDAYITHAQHEAFKTLALPHIADVCVVDFELGP
jgi:hypothetical protein